MISVIAIDNMNYRLEKRGADYFSKLSGSFAHRQLSLRFRLRLRFRLCFRLRLCQDAVVCLHPVSHVEILED
jgi:hypothetical protein